MRVLMVQVTSNQMNNWSPYYTQLTFRSIWICKKEWINIANEWKCLLLSRNMRNSSSRNEKHGAPEPCLDMSLDINTMMKKPFIKILFDQVVLPSTQWRLFSLPLLLCVWSQRFLINILKFGIHYLHKDEYSMFTDNKR